MTRINIFDPSGTKRSIPIELLDQALGDGSRFFSDNDREMAKSHRQISKQHPNMPNWLKTGLLGTAAGMQESPDLKQGVDKLGNVAGHFNRATEGTGLPAASGGFFSGASAPIRAGAQAVNWGAEMADQDSIPFLEKLGAPLPQAPMGAAPQIPGTNIQIPVAPTMAVGGDVLGGLMSGGAEMKALTKAAEAAKIPKLLSQAPIGAITGASLSPENPMFGAALGGAAGAIPLAAETPKLARQGTDKLGTAIKTLTKKEKPLQAFEKMVGSHDALDKQSTHLYDKAAEIAKTKNLSPIKSNTLDKSLDAAETHLGEKSKYKSLIERARDGEYDALDKVHKDMGKKYRKFYNNKNSTNADIEKADALKSARNDIHKEMQSDIRSQGHEDLADTRQKASDIYRKRMEVYFDKNLPFSVRNVFTKGKRTRPGQTDKDLIKPFMERSGAMDSFLEQHPEMLDEVNTVREKNKLKEVLGTVGKRISGPLSKGLSVKGLASLFM